MREKDLIIVSGFREEQEEEKEEAVGTGMSGEFSFAGNGLSFAEKSASPILA